MHISIKWGVKVEGSVGFFSYTYTEKRDTWDSQQREGDYQNRNFDWEGWGKCLLGHGLERGPGGGTAACRGKKNWGIHRGGIAVVGEGEQEW